MKDALTPILPDAWASWALSSDTRLLGAGLLLVLNFYISFILYRSDDMNRKEKQHWAFIVWMFPVMGFSMAFFTVYQGRKSKSMQARAAEATLGAKSQIEGTDSGRSL
ncbi:MAG: hypothetical protein ABMA26_25050 [Limisphaerales bacterium]